MPTHDAGRADPKIRRPVTGSWSPTARSAPRQIFVSSHPPSAVALSQQPMRVPLYLHTVNDREAWEAEAENWVKFARTPGHDAYWYYRDAFFDGIVPPPGRVTLEVGCGEGRVTRDLVGRGHRVVAVDGSVTLLRHATDLDQVGRYLLSDACLLPIASASIDLVVAYNSLIDFDDLSAAVAEVSRVLSADGSFCICITHPMQYSGGFDSHDTDAAFRFEGSYFGTKPFTTSVTRDDITMNFRGGSSDPGLVRSRTISRPSSMVVSWLTPSRNPCHASTPDGSSAGTGIPCSSTYVPSNGDGQAPGACHETSLTLGSSAKRAGHLGRIHLPSLPPTSHRNCLRSPDLSCPTQTNGRYLALAGESSERPHHFSSSHRPPSQRRY